MYKKAILTVFWLLSFSVLLFARPQGSEQTEIDIPYQKFVLDNGLTLIVHEDHKAPIVAVNVWYHVGSKNEKPGKTGFAHLFEHLMFNGSENYDDDYFKALERVGATDLNGTTSPDRTNYFQNVPSTALDVALWMESDRMGHLLGAISQERLDEQRGVVQNEKRLYENQPYGQAWNLIYESCYPKGHPYSWSVIGSMDDLDAASLEDVHEWFKTYYGPANAVISIAGDVDTETVRRKVEEYFGDIPSGPPVTRQDVWIAKRTGTHRQKMEDRVPQARIYKVWNIPEWGTAEADYIYLVADILESGKNSRFYKRLLYDDQIATDARAYLEMMEIGGLFIVRATAQPGQDLAKVERALDEEMARFLAEGPTEKELERVKIQYRRNFIQGIERIGGFGGKSDRLAESEVYGGSPDFYKVRLRRIQNATASDLQKAAQRWLSDGVYILEVHPFPEYETMASTVDRSKLPKPGDWPEVHFDELKKTKLTNGLEVIFAERHAIPMVRFNLLVDAGYAADQYGVMGTANLALDMMDEGTKSRTALEISEQLSMLGATLGTGSNLDMSYVTMSALNENLDQSLEIFADVILNPTFPGKELQRLKKRQIAAIKQEKVTPMLMALRVLPRLLYGEGHAYALPFTGSGTEESVSNLTREQLKVFHQNWFKPNNATLVVVGNTTLEEITPRLEGLLRKWKPGDVPAKNIHSVAHKSRSEVYLIDRPGSLQSNILAGHLVPPKANPIEIAIEAMNEILGGSFTSRINMNIREEKGWSYGAGSAVVDARGQRLFIAYAPVQSDKTRETMTEIQKELDGITSERPPTPDEVAKAKDHQTLTLPGRWETAGAVVRSIAQMVHFGFPDNYWNNYPDKVRGLNLAQISDAAKQVLHPDKIVWIIVGDREKIEDGIRELGFGEIQFIDADGNLLEADK